MVNSLHHPLFYFMEGMNWAAVIPARFLIAKDITSTQKLLIGLISSLSNLKGYCFASNEYLSKLLNVNKATVSHSISDLEAKGYIGRVIYRNDKQEIEQRILTVILDKFNDIGIDEKGNTLCTKNVGGMYENHKDNSKVNNKVKIKNNNTEPLIFVSSDWQGLWGEWAEYKMVEHRDGFKTTKSEQVAINKLVEMSGGDLTKAQEIVKQSIANRWKGLFTLKTNNNVTTKSNFDVYQERREQLFKAADEYDRQRGFRPREI